jgi:hypothetical protein
MTKPLITKNWSAPIQAIRNVSSGPAVGMLVQRVTSMT